MTKTALILCCTAPQVAAWVVAIERNRRYVDGYELRLDLLDADQFAEAARSAWLRLARALAPRPAPAMVIMTVRRPVDGGRECRVVGTGREPAEEGPQCEAGRQARFLWALETLPAAVVTHVDLELDADLPAVARLVAQRAADHQPPAVIRSFHDMQSLPADLDGLLARLAAHGELPKLAVRPQSSADLVRLAQFARRSAAQPKILAGIGEYAVATRVLAARLGSLVSFCSEQGAPAAAPGHLDPRVLQERFRFSSLTPQTPVFGVIGKPIAHSRSPEYHNARFQAAGVAAVYVPLLIDDIADAFALADLWDIRGMSITIPHKEPALPFLDEVDATVQQVAACNTAVRTSTGWRGTNSDVSGFRAALQRVPSRATIIGAGGAARACLAALVGLGTTLLVVNRSRDRAEQLAREFSGRNDGGTSGRVIARGLHEPGIAAVMREYRELIVQTTSVGMEPDIAGDPCPAYVFCGDETVYDIVYTPEYTTFLTRAAAAGCTVITGRSMFDGQAAVQFDLFLKSMAQP